MDLHLKGKVAVVLGGTTGIGAAAALRFAEEGCKVAVCSHSEEKVEAFRQRAAEAGYTDIMAEQVNATSAAQVEAFAEAVAARFGTIDIWVNCAGGNKHGPLYSLPVETFQEIIDLNLTSCFLGMKTACKYMMPQKSGAIINVSSMASKLPTTYRITYAAAKSGVNLLTAGAAAELAPYGITVNAVAPGIIDTALMKKAVHDNHDQTMKLIPLHRAGQPEDVGDVIVCVASKQFSYMTGTVVEVHGGKGIVEDTELAWSNPWEG